LRLFAKLNLPTGQAGLPNTQAFAALSLPKIPAYRTGRHQKSKPFKNQALYGQTLHIIWEKKRTSTERHAEAAKKVKNLKP
jgi:hypothetical protein